MSSTALLVAAWALAAPSQAPSPSIEPIRRSVYAMGTHCSVEVDGLERVEALAALEAALAEVAASEARLSTWPRISLQGGSAEPAGDLARLHAAAPGTWVECAVRTAAELERARHWTSVTGGAFDPAMGAWSALYDLRGSGRWPGQAEIDGLLAQRPFVFEVSGPRLRRGSARSLIDEGGWGKGAGLDAAGSALRERGVRSACLDLGGQFLRIGAARAVDIAHPDERGAPCVRVLVGDASLSTSGNSERGLSVDGRPLGHLIDPRTGLPALDWGSVSVRAALALDADCLSTAMFVLGPEAALAFADAHAGIDVLCLVRSGKQVLVAASPDLAASLEILDSSRCVLSSAVDLRRPPQGGAGETPRFR